MSSFQSKAAYLRDGQGVVLVKNGEIVSGASSYTRYREGIEIEVDTVEEERRKHLALIACSALILRCLDEGLYPSWDAQNMASVRLAEKLGYQYDHEYTAYEVTKNEDALYHIRVSGGSLLKIRITNLITGTRILCSVVLLFCPAFSPPFYVLYFVAGLTDMIDGPVARKTGTVNKLGAKLDTAADFVFVAVCLWKLLPSLAVPLWLWIWIVLIALIKMINIISGYVIQKKYVANHTVMNKVTGILLFVLPLTLPVVELKYSALLVCTVATFAAIQEGHYIRKGRDDL